MQYLQATKYNLHWKKGPIHAIPTCHKIHFTLERGPIHAIPTYQIEPIVEKEAHQCNTYISNATYTRKGSPSVQYLHIKCNLH
jgi:hypothetical protein